MTTPWQYLRQLATGATRDTPYDEERIGWKATSPTRRPGKHLWLPRPRRTALWLLLIDLTIFGLLLRIFWPLIILLVRNEELFGARLTLSQEISAETIVNPDHQKIPRILHQTCANDTIPTKWVESHESCKKVYSDFEYMLWTDDLAREFLASEYPWFVETWDNYPFPIQRADSIRYFVLHHYGGIYLDMDIFCNQTFPLHQVEDDTAAHHAVFQSTLPTGVTNDFMISSAKHPVFTAAISQLPHYYAVTRIWARALPYAAIMISSGPFFISWIAKNYLLELPSLPTPAVQVLNRTELNPYITDLQSASWHRDDTKFIMWLGHRPWSWFTIGGVLLVTGLYLINSGLVVAHRAFVRKASAVSYNLKLAKLT